MERRTNPWLGTARFARYDTAAKWADRAETILARCSERPTNVDAILVRPDGYVAWVLSSGEGDKKTERSLVGALEKWFGVAGWP
jgi:hypothetical protein